jgi:hypothetical protein
MFGFDAANEMASSVSTKSIGPETMFTSRGLNSVVKTHRLRRSVAAKTES